MIILRQRNYGLGSKVLAAISPNAWAGKELAKFQSATKDEYKKNRWKAMIKGVFAPFTTRKMLGKAQNMHGHGCDASEIAENTHVSAERSIIGSLLNAATGGIYNKVGRYVNGAHGIRTKLNENNPYWRKKFE